MDGPRFQAQGAWVTITTKLLRKDEFEQREITTKMVRCIFPLFYMPSPPIPIAPPQRPPSPPAPGAPIPPSSLESSRYWDGIPLPDV